MIKVEVWIGGTWLPAVLNPREGDSVAWLQVAVSGEYGVRGEIARIELPRGTVMRRRAQ